MTVSNGFDQDQTLYTVTIEWKNGFTHSYEQMLNDKQLISGKIDLKPIVG